MVLVRMFNKSGQEIKVNPHPDSIKRMEDCGWTKNTPKKAPAKKAK